MGFFERAFVSRYSISLFFCRLFLMKTRGSVEEILESYSGLVGVIMKKIGKEGIGERREVLS